MWGMTRVGLPAIWIVVTATVASLSSRATALPAPVVRIVASDSGFNMPRHVPAGLAELRLVNHGNVLHEGVLVHFIAPGSAAAYADSFRAGVDFPANAEDVGGPGLALPGDSTHVWLRLTPGRYAVLCFYKSHLTHGAARDFEVVPAVSHATPPVSDIQIHLYNYGFEVHGKWTAGHHVVSVDNAGPAPHEFDPYRLAPGKSPEDFFHWLEHGRPGPPPATALGGSGSMVRGRQVWLPLTLTPGRYFMFCEVTENGDSIPHYRHGMYKEFEVPAAGR
jgi:hypothetical protein